MSIRDVITCLSITSVVIVNVTSSSSNSAAGVHENAERPAQVSASIGITTWSSKRVVPWESWISKSIWVIASKSEYPWGIWVGYQ